MLNIASSIASVVASVDCLVLYGLYRIREGFQHPTHPLLIDRVHQQCSGGRMPGLLHGEQSLDAGLIMGDSAGILQISQQGHGLLWRQGKQRAIQKHIPRPLLALQGLQLLLKRVGR